MKELYHTYVKDEREAKVFKTSKGFEVDLKELGTGKKGRRAVYDHSESYAENLAENFVEGMFDLEPNDIGYYGYKQKSNNYVKGLDD